MIFISPDTELGEYLATHRGTVRAGGWLWYLGFAATLAAFSLLFFGGGSGGAQVTPTLTVPSHERPANPFVTQSPSPSASPSPAAVAETQADELSERLPMAGAIFGAALLLLALPIHRLTQRVEVYEHGFVWRRTLVTRRVLRREVTSVTIYNGEDVFVERAKGVNCTIKGIKDPMQLARFVGPQAMPVAPVATAAQTSAAQTSAAHPDLPTGAPQGWTAGAWQPPTRTDR